MCVEIVPQGSMGICCGFPTVFQVGGNAVEVVESDVSETRALRRLEMSRILGRARPVYHWTRVSIWAVKKMRGEDWRNRTMRGSCERHDGRHEESGSSLSLSSCLSFGFALMAV